jgi:hypothetical protein
MYSRAGLDAVLKRKIPSSRRESNPRTPIVQSVAQRYTTELSRLFSVSKHHAMKIFGGKAPCIPQVAIRSGFNIILRERNLKPASIGWKTG